MSEIESNWTEEVKTWIENDDVEGFSAWWEEGVKKIGGTETRMVVMHCVIGNTADGIFEFLLSNAALNDVMTGVDSANRNSAFHACRYGRSEMLKALIDKGMEEMGEEEVKKMMMMGTGYGDQALWVAAANGNVECVELICDALGDEVKEVPLDGRGQNGLHRAAFRGHWDVMVVLMDRGVCDAGVLSDYGRSVVNEMQHHQMRVNANAGLGGKSVEKVMEMLVDRGVDVNVVSDTEVLAGRDDKEVMEALWGSYDVPEVEEGDEGKGKE